MSKEIGVLIVDIHPCHPTHGPQVWPWWRVLTISVVRVEGCNKPPTYRAWNIWVYTRWGAWCWGWYPDRGKYA